MSDLLPNHQSPLHRYLPFTRWLFHYKGEDLPGDLVAGCIVVFMLVPQAMAYSLLVGVPPEYGLYASIVPTAVFGLLSSSRYVSVAPSAIISLMTAAGASLIATPYTPEFIPIVLALSLLTGLIQVVFGVLRLGFLSHFFSDPVLKGYISAASLMIALSQVKHVVGYDIPRESFFPMLWNVVVGLPQLHFVTAFFSLLVGVLLVNYEALLRRFRLDALPNAIWESLSKTGPLGAVVLSICLAWLCRFEWWGVSLVGKVPAGLPSLHLPFEAFQHMSELLPSALAIAFVAYMEVLSLGKNFAAERRQNIDSNQEFLALGSANLVASLTSAYPVSGGLSRSVVNFTAGARTGLASVIAAAGIVLTVLYLTPAFAFLPTATLAVIIMVAIVKLIDYEYFLGLWHTDRLDGLAFLLTFMGVLVFGIQGGLLIGVVVSVMFLVWRTSKPHVAIVGRVPHTQHYRNIMRYNVKICPHVLALRVDESLYFANTHFLEEKLLSLFTERQDVKHLVLICSGVNYIDSSAMDTLKNLVERLESWGINFHLAEVKGPVMDQLERQDFFDALDRHRVFVSTHEAMVALGCESERKDDPPEDQSPFIEYFI